jgi:hypothetical protein
VELRLVAQIRAKQPCPAEGAILQDPGADETLCLTMERCEWHVESLGELGEGVLVLGVKQEPGEQRVWQGQSQRSFRLLPTQRRASCAAGLSQWVAQPSRPVAAWRRAAVQSSGSV